MKRSFTGAVLIIALSLALFALTPHWLNNLAVHADTTPARVEVWDPDLHTSNITDLSLTPGNFFTALVNVTGGGQIGGFDVSLNYNLTQGPNVLNIASAPLNGGLIDPRPGHAPPGCSVLVVKNGDITIPGEVRFAATFVGGCTVDATNGILFTMIFQVVGTGAGSIDLIQSGGTGGRTGSTLVGTNSASIPLVVYGAYFRNQAGIPPTPMYTYDPTTPVKGDTVTFNATGSYDPEQPTAPNHGLQAEPVVYDANGNKVFDSGEVAIYAPGGSPASGTSITHDRNLLFNDVNQNSAWDSGEAIIYDSDNTLSYTAGDVLVYGTAPAIGTLLSIDMNIRHVDIHQNSIWDNGYVWDYQDGSPLQPGNVTLHIFGNAATLSQGNFPVKLVVYDADSGLPNRLIQQVNVSPGKLHDIVVIIHLDKQTVNEGENVSVGIQLTNRGNQHELVDLNATYNFNGPILVANESRVQLTPEQQTSFSYTIQTGSLPAGSYTIIARAGLRNQTLPGQPYFTQSNPDNIGTASFIVQASPGRPILSLPLIAGIAVVIVVAAAATVFLLRRRRKEEV